MQIASVLFLFFYYISCCNSSFFFFLFVGVDENCVRVLVFFFTVTDHNRRFKIGTVVN